MKTFNKPAKIALNVIAIIAMVFYPGGFALVGSNAAHVAEAAANTTSATVNGGVSTTVAPSANVNVTMTVSGTGTGTNNDWHSSAYLIEGGSWTCVNTPDHNSGNNSESFVITAPSGIGTYDFSVRAYNSGNCSTGQGAPITLTDAIVVQTPQPNLAITNLDVNGSDSTNILPGESVDLKVDVTTSGSGSNNDWESTRYRIEGGSWNCENTSNHTSSGNYSETFGITAPNANGTYDVDVQVFNNNFCNGSVSSATETLQDSIVVYSTPPATNPALAQSCGLDIALVFDGSGSIGDTAYGQMQTAFNGFVDAFLPGTPTQMSISEFATSSVLRLGFTGNATTLHNEINEVRVQPGGQYTNWDAGLTEAHNSFDPRPAKADLIVFASDGNPNRIGGGSSASEAVAVDTAVVAANAAKADGIRIIALGIGTDVNTTNLEKISSADAVITSNFGSLASDLANLADQLCGGKILVQKQFDTDGDGQADMDGSIADPLLAGYTFDVNGTPSDPASQVTSNTGALEFEVENGTYSVAEMQTPDNTELVSATCENGQTNVGTADLGQGIVSGLSVGTDETISCVFVNSLQPGTLTVIKTVNGGQAASSDWQIHVQQQSIEVAGSPQDGSSTGTDYTLYPGSYTVSETGGSDDYVLTYEGDCDESGNITVPTSGNATCALVNTYTPACVSPLDYVDNNGVATPDQEHGISDAVKFTEYYSTGNILADINGDQVVNLGDKLCADYYLGNGVYQCPLQCTPYTPQCGDQLIDDKSGEQCDDGNIANGDGCSATCQIEPQTGSLTICKYNDVDGNGAYDSEIDAPLQWDMSVYANSGSNTGDTWNTGTNPETGCVTLEGFPYGNYDVTEATVGGWIGTYPSDTDMQTVTLSDETPDPVVTFLNAQSGSIHGQKWNDVNANQIRDCSFPDAFAANVSEISITPDCEPLLNGWTIFIDENGDGALNGSEQSMQTQNHEGQDGWYWFEDLTPGAYSVCEVPQTGWDQTYPLNDNNNCHTITVPKGNEGDTCFNPVTLRVSIGENAVIAPACNFGNQEIPPTPADLTIAKTDNQETAAPGDTLTYAVTVTNTGETDATSVQVVDTIPAEVAAVSNISDSGIEVTGTIVWDNLTVPALSSITLTFDGTLNAEFPEGTTVVQNEATLGCSIPDQELRIAQAAECIYSGTATDDTSVTVTPPPVTVATAPTLTIEKTADKTTVIAGGQITYTITVSNNGDGAAENVMLTDPLPGDFFITLNDATEYSTSLGDLAAGAAVTTSYTVTVPGTTAAGDYINTATASADNFADVSDSATVTVNRIPQVLGVQDAPQQHLVIPGTMVDDTTAQRAGKVLGAEDTTLAETGAGLLEYLMFVLAALLISFGIFGIAKANGLREED